MENKNEKDNIQPDITNYDYVWGSDQDQYEKHQQSAVEPSKHEIDQAQK
jgi:hypothetical protein